jgi:hypothetical protein
VDVRLEVAERVPVFVGLAVIDDELEPVRVLDSVPVEVPVPDPVDVKVPERVPETVDMPVIELVPVLVGVPV